MAAKPFASEPVVPPAVLVLAAALLALGIGPNVEVALLSIAVLLGGWLLLWRPGEPPILLFIFVFPWLQASVAPFYANVLGIELEQYALYGGDIRMAVVLSLGGLSAYAIGLRVGGGPFSPQAAMRLRLHASSQSVERWFQLYLLAWGVSLVADLASAQAGGLSQLLNAIANLRWVFCFVLLYAILIGERRRELLFLVVSIELLYNIGDYFTGGLKALAVILLLSVAASRYRLSLRQTVAAIFIAAAFATFWLYWTAVKIEYRDFLSGGEEAQIVTVDYSERIGRLAELIANVETKQLPVASDDLLRRIAYVEFFAVTLDYVPRYRPHENGALYRDAVSRPFMPRLLFPEKPAIDDSARTNKYTGLFVAGAEQGTSISIGWIGEAYIDFGTLGLFPAAFLVGLFYGLVYRCLIGLDRGGGLLGAGFAIVTLLHAGALENSFTKFFGGVVVSFVTGCLVLAVILPGLAPSLAGTRAKRRRRRPAAFGAPAGRSAGRPASPDARS